MPNFATSEYVLYKTALLQKNSFGVFLCITVYRQK